MLASGGVGGVLASGGVGGVLASGGVGGVGASGGVGGVGASGGVGGVGASGGVGGVLASLYYGARVLRQILPNNTAMFGSQSHRILPFPSDKLMCWCWCSQVLYFLFHCSLFGGFNGRYRLILSIGRFVIMQDNSYLFSLKM